MERHPDSSYPQRVSSERTHHGQEQRLLQESEERTDQGLQSCEAAKLCGGVPVGQESREPSQPALFTGSPRPSLAWLRYAANQGCTVGCRPLRLQTLEQASPILSLWGWGWAGWKARSQQSLRLGNPPWEQVGG